MIVIMGVSGCGKTTVGRALANILNCNFFDADDFHPKANINKMSKGIALNDQDRKPWLTILADNIKVWTKNGQAVLACSALKESYRKQLLSKNGTVIVWVYLYGSFKLIEKRINTRENHYMKPELLMSQFNTLEIPDYGIHVSIDQKPKEIVKTILKAL